MCVLVLQIISGTNDGSLVVYIYIYIYVCCEVNDRARARKCVLRKKHLTGKEAQISRSISQSEPRSCMCGYHHIHYILHMKCTSQNTSQWTRVRARARAQVRPSVSSALAQTLYAEHCAELLAQTLCVCMYVCI